MTGPLALVGGAEFTEGCTFDRELLDAVGADEVVLLATGWAYENPGRAVAAATTWFASLGVATREVPVYSRVDGLDADNLAAIRSAKAIYLTGVSAMHLRSVFKDSLVLDAVLGAWQAGAALIGSGAGADVLCDPMVDTRGGAFTVGLGVVSGVAVIPRSDQWSPDKVRRTIDLASPSVLLVELPERTAIVLDADAASWRATGVGRVVVHRAGSVVDLSELPVPSV